jgi:phage shock protein E
MDAVSSILWVLLFGAAFAACWALLHHYTHKHTRMRKEVHGIVTVSALLEGRAFEKEEPVFLDVRTAQERAAGFIPESKHVDFYGEGFLDEVRALDTEKTYVVYCRSGGRSGQAVRLMETLGFAHVYNMEGGLLAWETAGGPMVEATV